jgi:exosortase K
VRARTAAAASVFLCALGAAFALKRFYSTASAADLRFVLAPTTWLVEVAAGGQRFDWTSGGYLSTERRFLVAPACAGVNFLIVAFASLVLGFVRPSRPAWQNAGILVASAAAAYVTTVLANALRILIAIPLWTHGLSLGWLTGARLHELVGVVVFLGMLLLLHLAAGRFTCAPAQVWVPLLPYAGMLLVAPLLRGAYARPEFWVHAGIVSAGLLVAAVAVVRIQGRATQPHPINSTVTANRRGPEAKSGLPRVAVPLQPQAPRDEVANGAQPSLPPAPIST